MIRQATLEDIEQLTSLETALFDYDRVSRRQFRYLILKGNCRLEVDEEEGIVRGYALVLLRKNSSCGNLYSVAVSRHFQGLGLGRKLLNSSEQWAMNNGLVRLHAKTRTINTAMQTLFKTNGWEQYNGIISGYYTDGSDAVCFRKVLGT